MSSDDRVDALVSRWEHLREQGAPVSTEDLCRDCPELLDEVRRRLAALASMDRQLDLSSSEAPTLGPPAMAPAMEETLPPPPQASGLDVPTDSIQVPGYEILGELGRGGMGVVYKARQVGLNRLVALKMILAGSHAGPDELERFRTEAEAVARLQHPHIVQIYEVGEQRGLPYFSLEFCPGGSLNGTPLPAADAAQVVRALAAAMHAAHEQGIVHRDLKPANVLLGKGGVPRITDFGLARKLDDASGTTALHTAPIAMSRKHRRFSGRGLVPRGSCCDRGPAPRPSGPPHFPAPDG